MMIRGPRAASSQRADGIRLAILGQTATIERNWQVADMSETSDSARTIRVTRLCDQGKETDLEHTTPAERIAMMWPLAVEAWAFMGEPVGESRLPRHVVRVIRGKG